MPPELRCSAPTRRPKWLPSYLDFMYISFTVGLTCAISDVNVISAIRGRWVPVHSLISFFFYTTILGVVLNAIVTS